MSVSDDSDFVLKSETSVTDDRLGLVIMIKMIFLYNEHYQLVLVVNELQLVLQKWVSDSLFIRVQGFKKHLEDCCNGNGCSWKLFDGSTKRFRT